MAEPIILSDEEKNDENALKTPELLPFSKKFLTGPDPFPTILVLDDDPTPQKSTGSSLSIVVPETPMSDVCIVKCKVASSSFSFSVSDSNLNSNSNSNSSSNPDNIFSGRSGLICLESDSEPEGGSDRENLRNNETFTAIFDEMKDLESHSRFIESPCHGIANLNQKLHESSSQPTDSLDDINQVEGDHSDKENFSPEPTGNILRQKRRKANADKKNCTDEAVQRKRMTKDERIRLMEEKKLKKEQEKLQKAALKAEVAELKKMQKERQKWEKGKFAQKSIVAEIDTKVVELRSIGGHLLSRFSDKGFTYRITSNPIDGSIVWTMKAPEHISELSPEVIEIPYVLLVYEAEEFCNLVANESLLDHVSRVRSHYPSYTICYLINRLMAYIHKRDRDQYRNFREGEQCTNPGSSNGWKSPPVEEVLAKLTTHFMGVHSRHCVDEAELADHVVGLTCSLASCQFRQKLTRLSVNANGSMISKDFVDRNLIKKSPWLKALVAIPKVQPRFAMAIWKKYPTMKSLLSVYMDPTKSVHEKEFLLKDLTTEGLVGDNRRLGEVCSKRVYRVLMAQSGSIKTDDVENGADYFRN